MGEGQAVGETPRTTWSSGLNSWVDKVPFSELRMLREEQVLGEDSLAILRCLSHTQRSCQEASWVGV